MKARVLFTTHIHCSPGRTALLCVALLIVCCAISPMARAVNPPPDGGYPGFNTAEGQKGSFWLDYRLSEHGARLLVAPEL